jgi:hypothetical protein
MRMASCVLKATSPRVEIADLLTACKFEASDEI